ncbi:MAG TPA: hypothetical protein VKF36_13345 [Syntrophorhabdales bacterium]|nr:hypothetical protein [Syntrophorhabdales bacterium]
MSKVISRRQDLKITQVYLGKVSQTEAIRRIAIPHGSRTAILMDYSFTRAVFGGAYLVEIS